MSQIGEFNRRGILRVKSTVTEILEDPVEKDKQCDPAPDPAPSENSNSVVKKKLCRVSKGYSLERSMKLLGGTFAEICGTAIRNTLSGAAKEAQNGDIQVSQNGDSAAVQNIDESCVISMKEESSQDESCPNGSSRVSFSDSVKVHGFDVHGKETVLFEKLRLMKNTNSDLDSRHRCLGDVQNVKNNSLLGRNNYNPQNCLEVISSLEINRANDAVTNLKNSTLQQENVRSNSIGKVQKLSEKKTPKRYHSFSTPEYKSSTSHSTRTALSRTRSFNDPKVQYSVISGNNVQFSIVLDEIFQPEDILVRAGVNGKKIRVIAKRNAKQKSAQPAVGVEVEPDMHQEYYLPVAIDPYNVTAKVNLNRYLVIQAPLATV